MWMKLCSLFEICECPKCAHCDVLNATDKIKRSPDYVTFAKHFDFTGDHSMQLQQQQIFYLNNKSLFSGFGSGTSCSLEP